MDNRSDHILSSIGSLKFDFIVIILFINKIITKIMKYGSKKNIVAYRI